MRINYTSFNLYNKIEVVLWPVIKLYVEFTSYNKTFNKCQGLFLYKVLLVFAIFNFDRVTFFKRKIRYMYNIEKPLRSVCQSDNYYFK